MNLLCAGSVWETQSPITDLGLGLRPINHVRYESSPAHWVPRGRMNSDQRVILGRQARVRLCLNEVRSCLPVAPEKPKVGSNPTQHTYFRSEENG